MEMAGSGSANEGSDSSGIISTEGVVSRLPVTTEGGSPHTSSLVWESFVGCIKASLNIIIVSTNTEAGLLHGHPAGVGVDWFGITEVEPFVTNGSLLLSPDTTELVVHTIYEHLSFKEVLDTMVWRVANSSEKAGELVTKFWFVHPLVFSGV